MREPFCRARVYLTLLMLMEVVIGVAIIVVGYIYQRILGAYLAEMERRMLRSHLSNMYILGIQLIIIYLTSIAMWSSLWCRRVTPNVNLLLSIWMFFCFLIVSCGFGTIWALLSCADALESTAEISLLHGIDMYYSCPEWKLLWDGLQYHKECCGVHGYRDWMNATWMPTNIGQTDKCSPASSGDIILAPYACCKHSCTTCFENYIPRANSNNIPNLTLGQINTEGCLQYFTVRMWEALYILLALVLVAFKLDLFICCLAKYIVKNQCTDDEGEDNPEFQCDDDGRPLVVVKCPPNVRCVTFDEDDDVSTNQLEQSKQGGRSVKVCKCCNSGGGLPGYRVHQEVTHMSTSTQSQHTDNCECGSGGGGGGGGVCHIIH